MAWSRRWRATATAVALLWVLVPALGAIHGAIVSHVYCAEHDAFEHGADRAGHAAPAATAIAEQEKSGDLHDLCAFSDCILRTAVQQPCAGVELAIAAACPAVQLPVAWEDRATLPILAVAPKASPPLV